MELHLSCYFLYFAFLTFCMDYPHTKKRKKHLFTLGGTIWFVFSQEEEDWSPEQRCRRSPEHQVGWGLSAQTNPSASPKTQLTPRPGTRRALHTHSCWPGFEKQLIIFALWCTFWNITANDLRTQECLLKASTAVHGYCATARTWGRQGSTEMKMPAAYQRIWKLH